MPKTSKENDTLSSININNSKTTPGNTIVMKKTLLTPCRRLGLSRKLKITPTPNQNQNSPKNSFTFTEESTSTAQNKELSLETPLVKKTGKLFQKRDSYNKRNFEGLSKNSNNKEYKQDNEKPIKVCDPTADTVSSAFTEESSQKPTHLHSSSDSSVISNREVKTVKKQQISVRHMVSDSLIQTPKSLNQVSSTIKSVRRCLSMKKSSPNSPGSLSDFEHLSSIPKSNVSPLPQEFTEGSVLQLENVIREDEDISGETRSISRKFNKKRFLVHSSDEDDFVSLQNSIDKECNSDKKVVKENWNSKIYEIKCRIQKKESYLADLKQAAIYKRIHNLEELKQLIEVWKIGCQNGLQYLLRKLQEHGPMDMVTLLKKLNVPEFLSYNPDTDSFK